MSVARRNLLAAGGLAMAGPGVAAAKPGGGAGPSKLSTPAEAVAETKLGKLQGAVRDGVVVFKGVMYGKDTGGKARFRPPAAPAPWSGVRSALAYGPCCPQVARAGWASDETAFIYDWDDGFAGESCLRLNVWTPGLSGRRPVMVWIHGGGYEAGSCQELPAYDGERLARRGDVVVVSVNHRLGPFGYLDLSEADAGYAGSGNVGLLDLIAALEWVRDNAAAFGGDTGNVTVFGQSGGGAKINALMAMPAAKGLFHKAIVQSGSQLSVALPERSRAIAALVMKDLGVTDVARLAEVPAARLVAAGEAAKKGLPRKPGETALGAMTWQPVVDGVHIPAQTWDAAPALSADVPLLVGSTLNEYSPSLSNATLEGVLEAAAKQMLGLALGARGPAQWTAFRAAFPDVKPVEALSRIVSFQFGGVAQEQARRKAAQGAAPVWLYRFDWQTPVLGGRARAFHCSELAFSMDNIDRCLNATGGGAEARALAGRMADAWIAFARTGDPNHKGLPKWPFVAGGALPAMLFDAKCRVADDPDAWART